jgi:hypothetical protein
MKLNGRLGKTEDLVNNGTAIIPGLVVAHPDYAFMKNLYDAYRAADQKTREAFATVCESILKVPKSDSPQ